MSWSWTRLRVKNCRSRPKSGQPRNPSYCICTKYIHSTGTYCTILTTFILFQQQSEIFQISQQAGRGHQQEDFHPPQERGQGGTPHRLWGEEAAGRRRLGGRLGGRGLGESQQRRLRTKNFAVIFFWGGEGLRKNDAACGLAAGHPVLQLGD